jgi:hypothetical protein
VGCLIGILTLLFFMGLLVASMRGSRVPPNSWWLINPILALGMGLAFGFLGGATVKGPLLLTFGSKHPVQMDAGAGTGVFIIVLALLFWLNPIPKHVTDDDQDLSALSSQCPKGITWRAYTSSTLTGPEGDAFLVGNGETSCICLQSGGPVDLKAARGKPKLFTIDKSKPCQMVKSETWGNLNGSTDAVLQIFHRAE